MSVEIRLINFAKVITFIYTLKTLHFYFAKRKTISVFELYRIGSNHNYFVKCKFCFTNKFKSLRIYLNFESSLPDFY